MRNLNNTLSTAIAVIGVAAPATGQAGYYYEAVSSNEAAEQGGTQISTVHAWVDGDSAKVEFQEQAQGGLFQAGSYLLTADAGETLYLVNDQEMTVATIDFDQILGVAGSVMEAMSGVMKMEFGDFSTEKISETSGDTILGYSTTHSHYRTGYTMSISVMGFSRESRVDTDNQVWCSDDFNANGLGVWLRPDRFRTGNEDFDELIRQQYETIQCLPLRNEVVTTTSGSGEESVTTSTTEVIEIREESIPAAVFELPADYERVSLMEGFMGEGDVGNDEDESEEGPMPRLRDLFRR